VLDSRTVGFRFSVRAGTFSFRYRVQTGSGAHLASYPMGTGVLSLGIEREVHEADHSPPSSARVKECVELYLQYVMLWCLVKYRGNFTFYLYRWCYPCA